MTPEVSETESPPVGRAPDEPQGQRLPSAPVDRQVTVIKPGRGWTGLRLRELWEYRELVLVLTWRTVLVRYKQTVLGIGWALLQPFFLMVVFSLFFGHLAGFDKRTDIPYPIFAYAALVPWTFFANSLTQSSNSLVGSANLFTKVYFPRLSLPLSSVLATLVDFAVAFTLLVGMMVYYDTYPRVIAVVLLPALILLAFCTALGVGLWLSALNVRYRDVRYTLPFLTQLWLFVTPVVYPATIVPERFHSLLGVNPMSGVVEGFRWALLGAGPAPGPMLAVSAGTALVILATGAAFFRRMERTFADVV